MTTKSKKAAASQAGDDAFLGALARARTARRRLDEATDNLNGHIQAAEAAIASLKLGVSGSVIIDEDEFGFERYLLFIKSSDQWRLMTAHGEVHGDGLKDLMPLVNAPRSIRLSAVEHLKALVQQMAEALDHEIVAVTKGTEHAAGFVRSLVEPESAGADSDFIPAPTPFDAPF